VGLARLAAFALSAALGASALAGCAGAGRARGHPDPGLADRLAGRAARWEGHAGPFAVGERRYPADCSGFVYAVYEAEGIPLRRLAALAAPRETSGAAALHRAAVRYGVVFGGGGEWPAPGDLVFFHDTYDRDRNGGADDRFTHVGVVEYVSDGTVVFLHRGGRRVVRAAVTPDRPLVAREGKTLRNSPLREKRRGAAAPALAGALFAGYGRVDPRKLPAAR
jgi:cell wall-associated NlpC family hydrolase